MFLYYFVNLCNFCKIFYFIVSINELSKFSHGKKVQNYSNLLKNTNKQNVSLF